MLRTTTTAVLLAAVLALAAGCGRTGQDGPSDGASATETPTTTSDTGTGRLALVGFEPGGLVTGVLVVDLASGEVRRVSGAREAWSPAWLDGGRQVALVQRETSEAPGRLVVVAADGSGASTVVEATAQVLEAASTPDGRHLVWLGRTAPASELCDAPPPSEPLGLYTADSTGTGLTGVRRVVDLPATARSAVPSPDGRTVVVLDSGATTGACDGGDARMVLVDVATGQQRVVSGLTQRAGVPAWSPDGRTVVVDGDDFATDQTRDVVLVDVSSATARRLVTPGTDEGSPVFSPDGRHLALLRRDTGAAGLASASVVLAGADGGDPRVLALTGTDDEDLAWTPDGAALVVAGAALEPACGLEDGEEDDTSCDVGTATTGVRTVDVATGALRQLDVVPALTASQLAVTG